MLLVKDHKQLTLKNWKESLMRMKGLYVSPSVSSYLIQQDGNSVGLRGDDFLAIGLCRGRVVYSYNPGSATASVSSNPLDLSHGIHKVHLGRSFQAGWLKVDDQQNKSTISPGKLAGLNAFSQFYAGGYSEYIPDPLPNGANF
ncbi:hypothetical protein E5288_WYG013673 [Bos mutus]|uniref:Laminin G domain-containing protein n=1 Tax=Bos mutus TaxID=72004 RepID=A0A6B0QSU4_9CETA|nr:hypothetical protein [Bos mutus]